MKSDSLKATVSSRVYSKSAEQAGDIDSTKRLHGEPKLLSLEKYRFAIGFIPTIWARLQKSLVDPRYAIPQLPSLSCFHIPYISDVF